MVKDYQQDKKNPRVVPCSRCRNRKRRCLMLAGNTQCNRCLAANVECSGASPGKLWESVEAKSSEDATVKTIDISSSPVRLNINASAPASRITRMQLTAALSFQLVGEGIAIGSVPGADGCASRAELASRFGASSGKLYELPLADEVTALSMMLCAISLTSHSAIVDSGIVGVLPLPLRATLPPSANLHVTGFLRGRAAHVITTTLNSKICELLSRGKGSKPELSARHWWLAYLATGLLELDDCRALTEWMVLHEGVNLVASDCPLDVKQSIAPYVQERISAQMLLASLKKAFVGLPSAVLSVIEPTAFQSPHTYHLGDGDLSPVFSSDRECELFLQQNIPRIIDFAKVPYNTLGHVAYRCRRNNLSHDLSSFAICVQSRLASITSHVGRLRKDPRYIVDARPAARPGRLGNAFFLAEMILSETLFMAHNVSMIGFGNALMAEDDLGLILVNVVEGLAEAMVVPVPPATLCHATKTAVSFIALALGLLPKWTALFPAPYQLLRTLMFSLSYNIPKAGEIYVQLEKRQASLEVTGRQSDNSLMGTSLSPRSSSSSPPSSSSGSSPPNLSRLSVDNTHKLVALPMIPDIPMTVLAQKHVEQALSALVVFQ